ncbi:hypothetical protein SPRG_04911 [Saprolegnia parasitica CBS 223.65]|uniref:Uncharacterized protein n=1 Tax=Saprolegnia parasitica (strain CBS 223.65) TaxID=695850 RepID=A0A067CSM6_SAPPC|nr:hypothetical protein SPRG_04911 [Saprolegnia parasitica CBS 223.65]KDO29797.1 hypothetical protein SPRG_04911 [Saprolegnia parasitica CBS 223.65]|eukprot:XP_012199440.1 hypothetical protein SPRG_04911 [Saprolegnia parasitica CBS 223.65]
MTSGSKEAEGQLRAVATPCDTMAVAPLPAAGKPLEHETEKAPSYFAWATSPRRSSPDSLSRDDELKRTTKMHLEQLRASAASLQQSLTSDRLDGLTRQRRQQCKANIEHLDQPSAVTIPIVSEALGPPLAAMLSPPPLRSSRRAVLPAMPVHPLPMHPLHKRPTPEGIQPMVLKPSTIIATTKPTKKVRFEVPMVGRSKLQATLEAHLKQRLAREKMQLLQKIRARSRKSKASSTDSTELQKTTASPTTDSPKEVPSTANKAPGPTMVASADAASTSHEANVAAKVVASAAVTPKPERVHRVPSHIVVPFFPQRHRNTNPLMLHPRYPIVHPRHLYTTEYTAAYCKPKHRTLRLK